MRDMHLADLVVLKQAWARGEIRLGRFHILYITVRVASKRIGSNGCSYAIGTMVWTLFDYYGEPSYGGWPYVSSTFGAFDLAGFAKAASYWFRSQWLYAIPDGRSVCWVNIHSARDT